MVGQKVGSRDVSTLLAMAYPPTGANARPHSPIDTFKHAEHAHCTKTAGNSRVTRSRHPGAYGQRGLNTKGLVVHCPEG